MLNLKKNKNIFDNNQLIEEKNNKSIFLLSDKNTLDSKETNEKLYKRNLKLIDETAVSEDDLFFSSENLIMTKVLHEEEKNSKIQYSINPKKKIDNYISNVEKERISETSIQIIDDSKAISEAFERSIGNKNEVNIIKKDDSIAKVGHLFAFLQNLCFFLKILFGCLLIFCSLSISYTTYLDEKEFSGTKIFTPIIEPIILIISFFGIIPNSTPSRKKIISVLYLWTALFLVPFTFLSKSDIINSNLNLICEYLLFIRMSLLALHIFFHFLSIILKMPF